MIFYLKRIYSTNNCVANAVATGYEGLASIIPKFDAENEPDVIPSHFHPHS
jgi:hypothetical protein